MGYVSRWAAVASVTTTLRRNRLFSTIKRELVNRYKRDDAESLRIHLFDRIETWDDRRRLHTSVGMRTPNQAYRDYLDKSAA